MMRQKGFTIFVAIMVTGTLTLIAMGIAALVVRQSIIATSARASQAAFYAADTAAECGIYWDVVGISSGGSKSSAFSTTTAQTISCNRDNALKPGDSNPSHGNLANQWVLSKNSSNPGYSIFTLPLPITFYPYAYCAVLTVYKYDSGPTIIEAKGYNTCDTQSDRRVERAVRVGY